MSANKYKGFVVEVEVLGWRNFVNGDLPPRWSKPEDVFYETVDPDFGGAEPVFCGSYFARKFGRMIEPPLWVYFTDRYTPGAEASIWFDRGAVSLVIDDVMADLEAQGGDPVWWWIEYEE